jgi:hypothetical protein
MKKHKEDSEIGLEFLLQEALKLELELEIGP